MAGLVPETALTHLLVLVRSLHDRARMFPQASPTVLVHWTCVLWLAVGCSADHPAATPACPVSSFSLSQSVLWFDRVDLLFVVDDSPLMAPVQPLVQREIARMVALALNGGAGEVPNPLPPVEDLHVGVVSADMGVAVANAVPGCSEYGDDGVLALGPECASSDPRYVWHFSGYHDAAATAAAVSCRSRLGSSGCSIAQPLEAALKALLPGPGMDADAQFRAGTLGHGKTENARFARNDLDRVLSLIVVVVITNQDDCSAENFGPADTTAALRDVPIGLRCALDEQHLYAIQRYVDGLRALRADYEELLQFVVIAGVPPDLTRQAKQATVRFYDTASLDAYYAGVLADPRMQLRVSEKADQLGTSLVPSCSSDAVLAYPPRRLVEMARGMGSSATLGSLCDAKPGAALYDVLANPVSEGGEASVCLPHRMVRNRTGTVACRLTWELPRDADPDLPLTPTACDQRPEFLSTPQADFPRVSPAGRVLCEVRQAPVMNTTDNAAVAQGEGFYYDDFTHEFVVGCRNGRSRIGFSPAARPPSGVTVHLDCLDDIQREPRKPGAAFDTNEPTIGTPCDRNLPSGDGIQLHGDALCAAPSRPEGLFCHPERNVCVRACESDAQCPLAWICDRGDSELAREAGRAICVNPSCSLPN